MTATAKRICDVFVSNALADINAANEITEHLRSAGLAAFHDGMALADEDLSDAIWEALAESRALIVVVTPHRSPHAMGMVEIGAAEGWNKPIFVVISGPSSTKLPGPLAKYPVYPLSRLDEVIRAVRMAFDPLSERERNILASVYKELNTPVDKFGDSIELLDNLTNNFNEMTHNQLSGERLLSELLRMRKGGTLPRLNGRKSTR